MNSPSNTPDFQAEIARLRRPDNFTNILFIGRAWLIAAMTIGVFIAFDLFRAESGWHWIWDLPLLLIALIIVGASQHQLAGAGHEATHYSLFKNRRLNEFVSDWFCMFPILTSTSVYREQHLAHHLHVNAPGQDPDLAQLRASGHDFDFPMSPGRLSKSILRQLWFPNLIRYLFHRAHFSAVGIGREKLLQRLPNLLFFPYFLVLFAVLGLLAHLEQPISTFLLATAVIASPAALIIAFQPPDSNSPRSESPFSRRTLLFSRFAYTTSLLLGLTLIHHYTGLESLTYFALLWCVPLLTTFSFFMMLRQIIQHGNCDRGKYTNTRVFFVNPLLKYAIFPFGMDYHLPHHLYATVPHYRLPELHEILQNHPEYDSPGAVVSGCFTSNGTNQSENAAPSVVEVLGANYAPGVTGKSSSTGEDSKPPKK